jgi:putative ABC transport system ATP-binding protein
VVSYTANQLRKSLRREAVVKPSALLHPKGPAVIIDLHDVFKYYTTGTQRTCALHGVSLTVQEGELVTILGPSGSGKSTLLNIIGGIDRSDGGTVAVAGQDVTALTSRQLTMYRRKTVGFVFQLFNLIPTLTVRENIQVTATIVPHPLDVDEVLAAVGLQGRASAFPSALSGGEQQRVAVARAVVKRPALLLCDEPTGSLDYRTSREVLGLLERINGDYGTTMLLVTHNTAIASMAHHIIRMRSGEVEEDMMNDHRSPASEVTW